MPGKRNRKPRRRQHKRRSTRLINLGRAPIAKQALVSFRYCDTVAIDASTGVTATHVFRANSLFDPDFTGLGHQPLGFDQWSVFYDEYCVLGAKINVMPVNTQTVVPIQFGIILRQGAIAGSVDPNLLKEQGSSTWAYAGNMNNMRQRSLTKKISVAKFTGFKSPNNESSCRASMSANPSTDVYFQLWCSSANQTADPASVKFNVTIDFISLLSMPKKLAQS